jgi:hypothetical protein
VEVEGDGEVEVEVEVEVGVEVEKAGADEEEGEEGEGAVEWVGVEVGRVEGWGLEANVRAIENVKRLVIRTKPLNSLLK